jgi:hypothetical protein
MKTEMITGWAFKMRSRLNRKQRFRNKAAIKPPGKPGASNKKANPQRQR